MSDTSQGPGWWQASDGKWYPPQPTTTPPPPAPTPPPGLSTPPTPPQAAPPPASPPAPAGADGPRAPGWWQASDGRWYPPQSAAVGPPIGADAPLGPGWYRASDGRFYPPPLGPAGPPPVKKPFYKRLWFWLLIAVVVLFGGCGTVLALGAVAVVHDARVKHLVVYSVTGTGQATDITYATIQQGNGQNGSSQVTDVPLPWMKAIIVSGLITSFTLSGTVGSTGGTVTCTITEDGRVLSTNTATGAFAAANCSSTGTP
jgi:hypothetical protein